MHNFELTTIHIDKIQLDPQNPRIPKSLHDQDEESILKYMVDNASVIELINSIGENSFFPGEPIILIKNTDTTYKVIEGNRRVSALKLIHDLELSKKLSRKIYEAAKQVEHKPIEIPSLISENEKDIHKFLGFRHITGIKNWNALEKARYLYHLKEDLQTEKPELSNKNLYYELAKSIGSRSDYVRRILYAYELYLVIEGENFYNISGLNDTTLHFVNISDALNRKNIVDFLNIDFNQEDPIQELNKGHLKELIFWLYEKNDQLQTRIKGTSTHLSKLSEVVVNKEALDAFRNGKTLDEALFLTLEVERIFYDSIRKSLSYLQEADNMVHKLEKFPITLDEDLKEIVGLCKKIKLVKNEKSGDEFEL